jgi:hypothetical protein
MKCAGCMNLKHPRPRVESKWGYCKVKKTLVLRSAEECEVGVHKVTKRAVPAP